jgi:hypothetical protein
MPRITRARAQFLPSMPATLGHFSRPVCPTLGNFGLTPRPKDSIRPHALLGEHQVRSGLIKEQIEDFLALHKNTEGHISKELIAKVLTHTGILVD